MRCCAAEKFANMKIHTAETLAQMFEDHFLQMRTPDDPENLYAPIRYALGEGGKRMRPTLLLLSYNLFGDNMAQALDAAAAIETFHNFTLLHDDIMDNASMRRGRPSVYAKWGENVAILSGDAMLINAYAALQRVPAEVLPQVLHAFNNMAAQVCEGQQYDMDFEQRNKVSVVDYMHMIELKTSVLLAGATTIGALLAGASDDDVHHLHRFAIELGLAFQLQDDLLDSYGDERLGKKIGGDILEGKQTYLMVTAMSNADEGQREVLRTAPHRDDWSDEQKIAAVKAVYDALDVPHLTEQQINNRFARATAMLDALSVPAERTEPLRTYAASLIGRKR